MKFDTVDAVRSAGFSGFKQVRDLREANCDSVPDVAGVYLVARDPSSPPKFMPRSRGGKFKDRNPTLPLQELEANWVDGAAVLYIGKAGGGGSRNTLRKRIRSFMRFGGGHPVGHWGGRLIWQLDGCDSLIICWRRSGSSDAAPTPGCEKASSHG